MLGLAHAILHVGLCSSMARVKPDSAITLRARLVDRRNITRVAPQFQVQRGDDDNPKVVEFDAPQGTYRLDVIAPQFGCSASQYLTFLADRTRSIAVALENGPAPPDRPLLMAGASPQSFLYVAPTFVLFDKGTTACNKPVGEPVPFRVDVENDQDAYYASLYADQSLSARGPLQLALRLKTPTHQYHYVRVPIPFPMPWGGWPDNVQFDVTQDEIDGLASEPVNTLLCLHLWETKVYL
ncbi:MAG: hypothetical protein JOY69_03240 [Candidatus Eremiobacteraeota bacterium]|nr:hypothetical protein [Candidatus Eremiobacteraeota bacterium]